MNLLLHLALFYGAMTLGSPTNFSPALSTRTEFTARSETIIQQRIADKKAQIAAMGANYTVITTMEELRAAIPGENIWAEIWEPSILDDSTTALQRRADPLCSYVQEHSYDTFDSGFKWDLWSYNNVRRGQGKSMPFGLPGMHISFNNADIRDYNNLASFNTVLGQCSLTLICESCIIRAHGGAVGSFNSLTDAA